MRNSSPSAKLFKASFPALLILSAAGMAIASPTYQIQMHKSDLAENSVHSYIAEVVSGPVGIYDNGDFFRTFCLESGHHVVIINNYFLFKQAPPG